MGRVHLPIFPKSHFDFACDYLCVAGHQCSTWIQDLALGADVALTSLSSLNSNTMNYRNSATVQSSNNTLYNAPTVNHSV